MSNSWERMPSSNSAEDAEDGVLGVLGGDTGTEWVSDMALLDVRHPPPSDCSASVSDRLSGGAPVVSGKTRHEHPILRKKLWGVQCFIVHLPRGDILQTDALAIFADLLAEDRFAVE